MSAKFVAILRVPTELRPRCYGPFDSVDEGILWVEANWPVFSNEEALPEREVLGKYSDDTHVMWAGWHRVDLVEVAK